MFRPGWRVVTGLMLLALVAGCAPVGAPGPAQTPSAERGSWVELSASPLSPRHGAAGAWVQQRFMLVGGWANSPCPPSASCLPPAKPALRDGASYDPATGTWQPIAEAPVPVSGRAALVLDDQLYLLVGDSDRSDSPLSFLRYNPGTDEWTALPTPDREWSDLIATDRAIVSMYSPYEKGPVIDQVFDPERRVWAALPRDPLAPSASRSAAWLGDRLLLTATDRQAEGEPEQERLRMAALDADLSRWTALPDAELSGGYPVSVAGSVAYPFVNFNGDEPPEPGPYYPYGAVLDPATGRWDYLPDPPRRPGLVSDALVIGDRVEVGGHLVNPATGAWTVLSPPPGDRRTGETVLASSDAILVWGGSVDQTNLASGYLLRP